METNLIAKRRKERKLTQVKMAEHLNMRRETYNKYESQGTFLHDLEKICEKLDLYVFIIPKENMPKALITPPEPVEAKPQQASGWREKIGKKGG